MKKLAKSANTILQDQIKILLYNAVNVGVFVVGQVISQLSSHVNLTKSMSTGSTLTYVR